MMTNVAVRHEALGTTPYLVYEMQRRAYPVGAGPVAIGRDPGSNIIVSEPTVSRSHARIHTTTDGLTIENIGATGTRLNGAMITQATPVRSGDRIEIGTAVLTLRRGPLPIGVTLASGRPAYAPVDEISARRTTIRRPILPQGESQPESWQLQWWWLIAAILIVAAAIGLLVSRL